jgi:hypothetical protein
MLDKGDELRDRIAARKHELLSRRRHVRRELEELALHFDHKLDKWLVSG